MEIIEKYGMVFILAALGLFFLAERLLPLRQPRRPLLPRLSVNAGMSLLTLAVASVLVRPTAIATLNWAAENKIGLLAWLPFPNWAKGVLGFLLLDLSFYYWHRLNHRVAFLWRFHNVHHFDPDLDASTGFRFHCGEVALSTLFRMVQLLAIGASMPLFLVYEFCFQIETYFHHSNLRLSRRVDHCLNLFIVTPRMHGIHHSDVHEEADSNYSVVLSIWDRLHSSLRTDIPQARLSIGVPGYAEPTDNQLGNALLAPLRRQRPYWQRKDKFAGGK